MTEQEARGLNRRMNMYLARKQNKCTMRIRGPKVNGIANATSPSCVKLLSHGACLEKADAGPTHECASDTAGVPSSG